MLVFVWVVATFGVILMLVCSCVWMDLLLLVLGICCCVFRLAGF